MTSDIMQAIEQMGREKGIDIEIIVGALEDAITTASRKHYKSDENIVTKLNRETGVIDVYVRKNVVDSVENEATETTLAAARRLDPAAQVGGTVDIHLSTKGLGRIEAQAAKQVIFQKVREAERDIVYLEYAPRVGEMLNGTVKRFERGDVVLDIGKAEAILPRRFQSRAEVYAHGERVRGIVVEVSKHSKGPQVVISRTDPYLVVRLFEMEVPEIYDGTVTLRNAVREPGDRAKVAVSTREKDVDPVGACVGMKGSRVQAIIRELRGEKIDIVPWSEEVTQFAAAALNPAKVGRVTVADAASRVLQVVVEDAQLSLAIGKRGQNVRLASRLIGWRIDIKSEEERKKEAARIMMVMGRRATAVSEIPGVAEKVAQRLMDAGYKTVEDLVSASLAALVQVPSVGAKSAEKIKTAAQQFLDRPVEADPPVVTAPASEARVPASEPGPGEGHED